VHPDWPGSGIAAEEVIHCLCPLLDLPVDVVLPTEDEHRDEGEAFVAVDEELPFGDPVREDCRLRGEVGLLVVGVCGWSCDRAFEASAVSKVILRLGGGCVDDRRVQLEDVLALQVDRLVARRIRQDGLRGRCVQAAS
jgi:hypothetical protein